jgi:glycerol-3-phosphate acyltransferase PlsY
MPIILIVAAYLLGSVPSGFIFGRLVGVDVRRTGSGNIGATNVARVLGKGPGLLTLIADVAKGLVPVLLARWLSMEDWLIAGIAAAAFLGHLYPIFLRFQGGKGVATALGSMLAIAWPATLVLILVFAGAVLSSRRVSLGSITAAAAAPFVLWALFYPPAFIALGAFLASMIILRHRDNISRLLAGSEPRFGER